jgi:hypothetical protein
LPSSNSSKIKSIYSPWRELIPSSRTCQDALIPDEFCVCDQRRAINVSDQIVIDASLALINHINNLVPHPLCQNITLNKSLKADVNII